ncbi:hypothetical protein, partial [Mycobacterium kiyosense]|uniref:hypothetical protein n=1 Tax=Mycobacterium kiyosense TaxID=2871094 RepID=UPI00222E3E09
MAQHLLVGQSAVGGVGVDAHRCPLVVDALGGSGDPRGQRTRDERGSRSGGATVPGGVIRG